MKLNDFTVLNLYNYGNPPSPLRLKHKDVFLLIKKHSLFGAVSDRIVQLMEFEAETAVTMLIENRDKILVRT